jgi:hypothetical protein
MTREDKYTILRDKSEIGIMIVEDIFKDYHRCVPNEIMARLIDYIYDKNKEIERYQAENHALKGYRDRKYEGYDFVNLDNLFNGQKQRLISELEKTKYTISRIKDLDAYTVVRVGEIIDEQIDNISKDFWTE